MMILQVEGYWSSVQANSISAFATLMEYNEALMSSVGAQACLQIKNFNQQELVSVPGRKAR